MLQYFHDVNAYVEQDVRYQADKVVLKLDEATNKVTVDPVDEYNNVIAGKTIVSDTFTNFTAALAYYQELAHQLSQGDVIRNYNLNGMTIRSSYTDNNSRY